tara:strand:+ start:502 stop:1335 length:834 start_codon:yes stop_codon:yes gene_type:complete
MSLNTLENLDRSMANAALAMAAMNVAGPGMATIPEKYSEISHRLVKEVKLKLAIPEDDNSAENLERVRVVLAAEVDKRVYDGVDRGAVRRRLGARGALPTAGYKISFAADFAKDFGEKESFVRESVLRADYICHLGQGTADGDPACTIFARKVRSKDRRSEQWALIQAQRTGDKIEIISLWRIFDATVDTSHCEDVVDLLKAFLNVYGIEMMINDKAEPVLLLLDTNLGPDMNFGLDTERPFKCISVFRKNLAGSFEVAIAFAIDMKRYNADRIRYG